MARRRNALVSLLAGQEGHYGKDSGPDTHFGHDVIPHALRDGYRVVAHHFAGYFRARARCPHARLCLQGCCCCKCLGRGETKCGRHVKLMQAALTWPATNLAADCGAVSPEPVLDLVLSVGPRLRHERKESATAGRAEPAGPVRGQPGPGAPRV